MINAGFEEIISFEINDILTFGGKDKDKREKIREKAHSSTPKNLSQFKEWKFVIAVNRQSSKKRLIDLDNVAKIIIDSFSKKIIDKDNSKFVALYDDDNLKYVTSITMQGKISDELDKTSIRILGKK